MPFEPETLQWPDRRAIVLIHGVGSYAKADYRKLQSALEAAIATLGRSARLGRSGRGGGRCRSATRASGPAGSPRSRPAPAPARAA